MKSEIPKFLACEVELMKRSGARGFNGWLSTGHFILEHGRAWKTAPLPDNVRPMKIGECFRNAANLALGFHRNEYLYCEGIAVSIIPVMHAWCVDRDGKVIDPTWTDRRKGGGPIGCDYFGIAFKSLYLSEALSRQKYFGLIDAWRNDWPLFTAPESEWKHPLNQKPRSLSATRAR